MPVSSAEQEMIQDIIERSTPDELERHRRESNDILGLCRSNAIMPKAKLDRSERHEVEKAIEFFMRLEAYDNGKGWWFRQKRRAQMMKEYLGS